MNQYIKIRYKPDWVTNPNYWDFWFELNDKEHREKAPSSLDSNGTWSWYIHDEWENEGFGWDESIY